MSNSYALQGGIIECTNIQVEHSVLQCNLYPVFTLNLYDSHSERNLIMYANKKGPEEAEDCLYKTLHNIWVLYQCKQWLHAKYPVWCIPRQCMCLVYPIYLTTLNLYHPRKP